MWTALFFIIQIFLWVVVGGALAFIVIAPVFILVGLLEFLGAATINNLLNLIHKVPVLNLFSGLVATGIGVLLIFLGLWVWINYAFIMLRCLGGPTV